MVEHGFYKIKDEFFDKFDDPSLSHNKGERRPFFYCIQDTEHVDLYWVIPMTSQIEKLNNILKVKFDSEPENCDTFYINPFADNSAFLVIDAFPITKKYIKDKYFIKSSEHYIVKNKKVINNVKKRLLKIIGLKNKGITLIPDSVDIRVIKEKLLDELKNEI